MRYYHDSPLLYEREFSIIMNELETPIENSTIYYFDYDKREYSINMDFPHSHIFYEILILLSPRAKHYIAGIPYSIRGGDVVLLSPSVLHQSEYYPGPPSDRIIINFMYPKDLLANNPVYTRLLSAFQMPVPILRLEPVEQQTLYEPLNQIVRLEQLEPDVQMRNMLIHNKFLDFLYRLNRLQEKNIYQSEIEESAIEARIYAITNYIHIHYAEKLTLTSLANEFYMNVYYLSHKFKEVTGYTVNNYIQLTRIKNVQYNLLNSKDSISNIAQKAGFNSFSQFNRVFNRICQMSPSEYQRREHNRIYTKHHVI